MKVAAIIYHKNINSLYQKEWIEKSFHSITNQTFKNFTIYELNYGGDKFKLLKEFPNDFKSRFFNIKMDNHAQAMNFLIDKCLKDGYDVIFNNNLDDISHKNRFELQIQEIKNGYDLVASNFIHIDDKDREIRKMSFSKINIKEELQSGHNIICHPSVCFSRNFLEKNRYISSEIPEEDFRLWKRTIDNFKFYIHPEYLINYRIHSNQITFKENVEKESQKETEIVKKDVYTNPIVLPQRNLVEICRFCGEPKNKLKYNFCPKCNTLY